MVLLLAFRTKLGILIGERAAGIVVTVAVAVLLVILIVLPRVLKQPPGYYRALGKRRRADAIARDERRARDETAK